MSTYDHVDDHPNMRDVLVVAGGQAYVVDPLGQNVRETFGAAIVGAWKHPSRPWIIFNDQDIRFFALGPMGFVWESPRVSWDGLRTLQVNGERLCGEAWEPGDTWHPFELDLNTGSVNGGSYPTTLLGA
jgi:hypothetical protein